MASAVQRMGSMAVLGAALASAAGLAWTAQPNPAPAARTAAASSPRTAAAPQAAPYKFALLKKQFNFTLPASYAGREIKRSSGTPGDGSAWGSMFASNDDRKIVVVSEAPNPSGTQVGKNDNIFLTGAGAGYNAQQKRAHPRYQVQSEKTIVVKGLGMRRIEATDIIDGAAALSTALLAASGPTLAVVQVISGANDPQGHEALVDRILAGK